MSVHFPKENKVRGNYYYFFFSGTNINLRLLVQARARESRKERALNGFKHVPGVTMPHDYFQYTVNPRNFKKITFCFAKSTYYVINF